MITNELINRSIDYILQHLDEEISIDEVADYCHYSKYYFSRVFKTATGESIYTFIKRLKMEQSAIRLKVERDKSITDIGFDYGYSPSNYSSAFRKHHDLTPANYRKGKNTNKIPHPFIPDQTATFQTFEEYDRQIRIQELEDFYVIYERHIGNYTELEKNWNDFTDKYKEWINASALLIERSYADPSVTDLEQCLYDICITVDKNCTLENVTIIKGGKFAIYRFEGMVQDIFTAFQGMLHSWLAQSSYYMDERYCLDIYYRMDRISGLVLMDFCIPIK